MLGTQQRQFDVETISRCLASCDTCSGSYISMMLLKRLICYCECHQRKRRTHWQTESGFDSRTHTNPTVNSASEKSSSTYLKIETGIKNTLVSEGDRDKRLEIEERKEGLRGARMVGSSKKRPAAVTSKTTLGEDTIGR